MNQQHLTDQPLDLDAIDTAAEAATPGPWGTYEYGGDSLIEIAADLEDTGCGYSARRTIARFDEEPLDNDPGHREWTAEEDWAQVQADAAYIAAMPPEVAKALVAEVRRLRAERDEFCNRVDTLTAVAKGNKRHVQAMFLELKKAQAALEKIRHLHKDSPMGPCPVCIDADAAAAGGDGLMPYPCPTGRLAGAQDFDPPHVRAVRPVPAASEDTTETDDEPETGTRQCGHDDYHDPHEWADRPGIWCPGHSITDTEPAASEEQQ